MTDDEHRPTDGSPAPESADRAAMATSFGAATAAYEQGRPSYPVDAVAWMLDGIGPGGHVVDVGAGTGKLTGVIASLGFDVAAVDPDAAMLDKLHAVYPAVPTLVGSAESLPLDDGSAAAVTLGQAWHWVDPAAGCAEIGRVVAPGGALGLIWNIRDEWVPWVAALTEIVNHSAAERIILNDEVEVGAPFGEPERFEVSWTRSMTRSDLEQMVRSRSYYLAGDDARKFAIDGGISDLFDSMPELANGGMVDLPYTTYVRRSRRS